MTETPPTILIVDDDDVDRMGWMRAFGQLAQPNKVVMARDGVEALAILRGESDTPPPAKPVIVLLDLNMPRMNGFEFLDHLRAEDDWRDTVVFVVSTSQNSRDKAQAYERSIAGYIEKYHARDCILRAVEMLNRYQAVVSLP